VQHGAAGQGWHAAPLPKEWRAKEGEAIAVGVDPARLHLFDAGTQARL